MAGNPLGIPLTIDFGSLDRDLNKVADRIEETGKAASIKVGALAGGIASGDLKSDDIGKSVEQIGVRLSAGVASGVRASSAAMLGFGARMNAMFNRLAGAAITIFRRIDAAMKFPAIDAFFRGTQAKLLNFAAWWKKPLTDVDLAIKGTFGKTIANATRVMKSLFQDLANTIATAMAKALDSVVAKLGGLMSAIHQGGASAKSLMDSIEPSKVEAAFAKFPSMGSGGLKSTIGGPKIGATAGMTSAPAAGTPSYGFGDPRRGPISASVKDAIAQIKQFKASIDAAGGPVSALGTAMGRWGPALTIPVRSVQVLGSSFARLGALIVGATAGGIGAFRRLSNFIGAMGDVGKESYHKLYESHGLVMGSVLALTKGVIGLSRAIGNIATLGAFKKASGDAAQFGSTVKATQGPVRQLGGLITGLGGQIALAFGFVGVIFKTVEFIKNGVKAASDLNETVSKSKVIFGDAFGPVEAQADKLQRAFGIAKGAQLDVASGFGAMATGAGMTEKASAALANQMTQMAADLSSSVNIPFQEAGDKIRSALAGESEPLRQYGANISEAAVQSYALSHGLATSSTAISQQAAITARAALTMQGLGYAQGDLARTASSAANQFRQAGGGIARFGELIGELLLPGIQLATEGFNELLGAVLDVTQRNLPTIQGWFAAISEGFGAIGIAVRNAGDLWKIAQLEIGAFAINAVAVIETIPENFSRIWQWLGGNWASLLTDMLNGFQTFGTNLLTNASNLGKALWDALKAGEFNFTWTPLLDGFKATTDQLPDLIKPALISVDDEVAKIYQRIGEKEQARKEAMVKPGAGGKPGGLLETTKTKEQKPYQLGGALEVGSKEAFSALSRNNAISNNQNRGQLGVAKQSLTTQQQILSTNREQLALVKQKNPAMTITVK